MKKSQWKKAYKIKRKKSIFKNRFFLLGILILLIFCGIFYLVGFSPLFQIKEIKIFGNQKVQTQDLTNAAEAGITGKIFFLGTKSIFFADSDKINKAILGKYPQVDRADVKKDLPDSLTITVGERQPVAVIFQNNNYFYIDKNGIAFEKISETDVQKLKITNQIFSSEIELGKNVIAGDLLSQIFKIESKLKDDLGISLKEAIIFSEQRINVKTAEGWEAYFNLKGDLDWQITELKTVLENKILPQKRRNLEYIDLRFDRIFIYPEGLLGN